MHICKVGFYGITIWLKLSYSKSTMYTNFNMLKSATCPNLQVYIQSCWNLQYPNVQNLQVEGNIVFIVEWKSVVQLCKLSQNYKS